MKYGGMIQDLPFPAVMLPSTITTPLPKQIFNPPLKDIIGLINQVSAVASLALIAV